MTSLLIKPAQKPLHGRIEIPADKSLSHRAIMFGALCNAKVIVNNFSSGADCKSTFGILEQLGVKFENKDDTSLIVYGKGLKGFSEPESILDAGNSGTTMRLMMGLLAGQSLYCVMTGDHSLRQRPMGRVIQPLKQMGAKIIARNNNKLAPITIQGTDLQGIEYNLPIASAQVKSAILLAGLNASGRTIITEPSKSRDHTERLLKHLGANIVVDGCKIAISKTNELYTDEITIPGDISSAAFFMVAASIIDGSCLKLINVGINPTRTGIITVLKAMGADIYLENQRETSGEPVADIVIKSAKLKGKTIQGDIIPSLIDEIPVIAVAACFAEGQTVIKDAEDLRNKESDRLKAISLELNKIGADITETEDGLIINGNGVLKGNCTCDSHTDHRIAMSLTVAAMASKGSVCIENSQWINISFPEFISILERISE